MQQTNGNARWQNHAIVLVVASINVDVQVNTIVHIIHAYQQQLLYLPLVYQIIVQLH